ncbi:MAG: hypothetical protein WCO02_03555 [Bacteroidota bacterium]
MKKSIYLSLIAVLLCLSVPVLADGPPPPPSDPGSGGGGPVGAPIDGGLGILLVMGVVYGGKKLYKARKKDKMDEPATED